MIGLNLRELNIDEKKKLGLNSGFKVIGPLSNDLLKDTNVCEGFIILSVNGEQLTDLSRFESLLKSEHGVMIKGMYPDGTFDHYYLAGLQINNN